MTVAYQHDHQHDQGFVYLSSGIYPLSYFNGTFLYFLKFLLNLREEKNIVSGYFNGEE